MVAQLNASSAFAWWGQAQDRIGCTGHAGVFIMSQLAAHSGSHLGCHSHLPMPALIMSSAPILPFSSIRM